MPSAAVHPPAITRRAAPHTDRRAPLTHFAFGGQSDAPAADAATDAVSVALRATLEAVDEHAKVISALPVQFRRRVSMSGTATLLGTDPSGSIRVVATVTTTPPRLNLNLRYLSGGPALPRQLLASFRFLRTLRRPNLLRLTIDGRTVGELEEFTVAEEFPQALVEQVRTLAFVQAITGVEFALPKDFDDDDLRTMHEAEALLRGETVSSRWADAILGLSAIDTALLEAVEGNPSFRLEFIAPVVARIAGYDVPLGEAHYVFRAAVLENYDELVSASESERLSGAEAHLRPGVDDRFEVALVAPLEIGLDLQDVRRGVLASHEVLEVARQHPIRSEAFQPAAS